MTDTPFFYYFTSDDGTYYGTNAFIGCLNQSNGDNAYAEMQREIHQYITNGKAVEMFDDDPAGNFPWLYFNFTTQEDRDTFMETYGSYLHERDIRSKENS